MTRTFTRWVRPLPSRSNSCSCRTRRSFGCKASGKAPTSSRKRVPLSANSKRLTLCVIAPAKDLTFEQVEGNRRTVQLDQRLAATGTRIVNRVSDEFLASAGFSLDQNSRVHRRNPFGLFQDGSQGRTGADDLLESADPTFLICHYH